MSFTFRIAVKSLVFLSTKHRVLGVRDWAASLISTGVLLLVSILAVAIGLDYLSIPTIEHKLLRAAVLFFFIVAMFLVSFPALSFVFKLRHNGITDADYSVESGIDYKTALESAGADGFDFLGVGAAKLRKEENQFRAAVKATVSANKKIRMLLADPRSVTAFGKLAGHDETVGYSETISGSIDFISALADKDPEHLELHFYDPEAPAGFKPFRLFFADGACLISPFVKATGVANQGRGLPQVRISSKGWPKASSPTLYIGFENYFNVSWRLNNKSEPKDRQ